MLVLLFPITLLSSIRDIISLQAQRGPYQVENPFLPVYRVLSEKAKVVSINFINHLLI